MLITRAPAGNDYYSNASIISCTKLFNGHQQLDESVLEIKGPIPVVGAGSNR